MGIRFSSSQDPLPNEEKEKVPVALEIQTDKEQQGANIQTDKEEVLDVQTPTAGLSFERIFSISEEKVCSTNTPRLSLVGLNDIMIEEVDGAPDAIAGYCLPLIVLHFCGQTSCLNDKDSDQERESSKLLTLKNYLRMLDKFIRQHKVVTELSGEEEEYRAIIRLIATQRYRKNEESIEDCYQRLMSQSKRFIQIYHKRGEISELLATNTYWGSRQQLLAGKVIADWVDRENGSLDPIFGVLLNPTAGRVGPGDTGWFHDMLFDDRGHWAFHSAVHDAFGYLKVNHDVGPGYNYLDKSSYFHTDDTDNPMAGQLPGIAFWKKVISEIQLKQKVLEHWRL